MKHLKHENRKSFEKWAMKGQRIMSRVKELKTIRKQPSFKAMSRSAFLKMFEGHGAILVGKVAK